MTRKTNAGHDGRHLGFYRMHVAATVIERRANGATAGKLNGVGNHPRPPAN
jgi:hypothetical protein